MINRVGVCSWSLQPDGIDELVQLVQHCGLRDVQLALSPLINQPEQFTSLRNVNDHSEIAFISGMLETIGEDYSSLERIRLTGGVRPDEHWDANLERARQCAAQAEDLGMTLVTFHAGFIPHDDPALHQRMADRICMVAEVFNARGITLGLETGQERSETLLDLLSTISPRARIGVNFDPANMLLYAMGDPIESMRMLADHIVQVHMKDAVATQTPGTWGAEVVAGTGEVDWEAFFELVQSLPQEIDVVIEREAGDQRVEDIVIARKLAKAQIEQVTA